MIKPEPVACAACSGRGWYTCGASDMRLKCPECKGKKTAPPQREWQGLTNEELRDIFDSCQTEDRGYVAAMVEAKLKEKNSD
jgi:excinuclease UvrABC ATPase subunit